jgi:hypothetical protein
MALLNFIQCCRWPMCSKHSGSIGRCSNCQAAQAKAQASLAHFSGFWPSTLENAALIGLGAEVVKFSNDFRKPCRGEKLASYANRPGGWPAV